MSNGLMFNGKARTGAKPELKYVGQNKTALATVSAAFDRRIKKGDDWTSETCWARLQAWGARAERFAKDVDKGTLIHVEGYVSQSSWNDPKTNEKRSALNFNVEDYHLVFAPRNNNSGGGNSKSEPAADQPDQTAPPAEGSGPPTNQATETNVPEDGNGGNDLPF